MSRTLAGWVMPLLERCSRFIQQPTGSIEEMYYVNCVRRIYVWVSVKYTMTEVFRPQQSINRSRQSHQRGWAENQPCISLPSKKQEKKGYEYVYRNVVSILAARVSHSLPFSFPLSFSLSLSLSLSLSHTHTHTYTHNHHDVSNKGVYIFINNCNGLFIPAVQHYSLVWFVAQQPL